MLPSAAGRAAVQRAASRAPCADTARHPASDPALTPFVDVLDPASTSRRAAAISSALLLPTDADKRSAPDER